MAIQSASHNYYSYNSAKLKNNTVSSNVKKGIPQDHIFEKVSNKGCNQGYPSDMTALSLGRNLENASDGQDIDTFSKLVTSAPFFTGTAAVSVLVSPVDMSTMLVTNKSDDSAGISH